MGPLPVNAMGPVNEVLSVVISDPLNVIRKFVVAGIIGLK